MLNPFTSLEESFIRSSLVSKDDQEIADLLERPADEVRAFIDEITGGHASDRDMDVAKAKEEEFIRLQQKSRNRHTAKKEVRPKTIRKKIAAVDLDEEAFFEMKRQGRKKEKETLDKINREREQIKRDRDSRSILKTRIVDYSKMKSVRVDRTTVLFVPIDADPKKEIQKYNSTVANNVLRQKIKDSNF